MTVRLPGFPVLSLFLLAALFNPPARAGDAPCCCCCLFGALLPMLPEDCAFLGGACRGACDPACFQGGSCDLDDPAGACCLPSGDCSVIPSERCLGAGGTPGDPGSTCDGCAPCPGLGACIVEGEGCLSLTEDDCATAEGTFYGPGSCCADLGPCYIPGEPCEEATEAQCDALGGIFGGANQTCDISGACVDVTRGQCIEVPEGQCTDGVFHPNQTCADFVFGTCLQLDGSCVVQLQSACARGGGIWSNAGCSCDDTDCICEAAGAGSPMCEVGACRSPQDPDVCVVMRRADCLPTGLFCGGGSTCQGECATAVGCCQVVQGILTCDIRDARDCIESGGQVNPTMTTCDGEDPCFGAGQPCDAYAVWTGGGAGNDITDGENWSTGEAPTANASPAAFESPGLVVVSVPDDVSLGNLLVAQGSVGFLFGGHTVATAATSPLCHDLLVGSVGGTSALLDIAGGTIQSRIVSLGLAPGATGAIQVGAGGHLLIVADDQPELLLGLAESATGVLVVEAGGTAGSASLACAVGQAPGSQGEIVLRNPGTTLDAALMLVGSNGTGSVDVTASARLIVRGPLQAAVAPGSSGTIALFGDSTLEVHDGAIDIGHYGTAVLIVNAATFDAGGTSERQTIGTYAGSAGSVLLRGGADWDATGSQVTVGMGGQGLLDIGEGSGLECPHLAGAGLAPGSHGTILIDGAASLLRATATELAIEIGLRGRGQVSVTNGASLDWASDTTFGGLQGGDAALTVAGGTATFGSDLRLGGHTGEALLSVGRAIANVGNGGIVIAGGAIHLVGPDATLDNELLVGGNEGLPGAVSSAGLRIGRSGVARITGGGQLTTSGEAIVGDGAYGSGTVNPARVVVEGDFSTWNVAALSIGPFPLRPARLEVSGGGQVNAGTLLVGPGGWVSGRDSGITVGGAPSPANPGGGAAGGIHTGSLFVEPGAVLDVPSVHLLPGGVLGGGGSVDFELVNDGEISPGGGAAPLGTLTVGGNYRQEPGGVLRVELSEGGAHDALAVTGTAILGGALIIERLDCATVLAGQEHAVLTAAGVQGAFDEIIGPAHARASVEYRAGAVVVTLAEPVFDADCAEPSGAVDIADLLALLSQWGQGAPCDADSDGAVGPADLESLIDQWGPCGP